MITDVDTFRGFIRKAGERGDSVAFMEKRNGEFKGR